MEATADELARDLPGLPLGLRNCRVDEAGFHRPAKGKIPEAHAAWADVTGLRYVKDHKRLNVWGRRPSERFPARLLHLQIGPEQLETVRRAWEEYLLRRIERDGTLRGSVHLFRPKALCQVAFGFGVLLTLFGGLFAYRVLHLPAWAAKATDFVELMCFVAGLVLLGGLLGLATGAGLWWRLRMLRDRWARWELRRDGLVFWPRGGERVLVPSNVDRVTPLEARINGERVPLEYLTHKRVLARLLVSMEERAGADCRPVRWLQPRMVVFVLFATAVLVSVLRVFARLELPVDIYFLATLSVAGCLFLHVLFSYHLHKDARAALTLFSTEGRAMLERLGW